MALTLAIPPSLGRAKASARAQLLGDALVRWLAEPAYVKVAHDYDELEGFARNAEVELCWAPPGVLARIPPEAVRAVLAAVRHGRATFRAALVVRRDHDLSAETLAGARAVWSDPRSTGGHLLAKAWLRSQGYDPQTLFSEQRFAGSYEAALRAVLDGEADVCSVYVNGDDADAAQVAISGLVRDAIDVLSPIAITDPIPGDGLALTRALAPDRARELETMFTEAHRFTGASRMVLDLLDAESLERAHLRDWHPLREVME